MTDLDRAAHRFFDKWMPIYGMIVCIICFLFLAAMGTGLIAGLVRRALT